MWIISACRCYTWQSGSHPEFKTIPMNICFCERAGMWMEPLPHVFRKSGAPALSFHGLAASRKFSGKRCPIYSRGLNYLSIHYRARACSGALGVIKYGKSRLRDIFYFSLTPWEGAAGVSGSPLFQCGFRPWNNGGTVTSEETMSLWNYLDSKSMCYEYVAVHRGHPAPGPLCCCRSDGRHETSVLCF